MRERKFLDHYPELMKEWHFERNKGLNPELLTFGSDKRVWWCCEKGHEWEARIANRVRKGNKCPYCSGRIPIKGETDLATTHPHLVSEWDDKKNLPLTIFEVSHGSSKKVWWCCEKGHEWETTIEKRTRGSKCPMCKPKRVLKGQNDLSTTHPLLAKEFHPTKNRELSIEDASIDMHRKVWWVCERGHEYEQSPYRRGKGAGCQYCCNQKVLAGFNDLETTNPLLAKEWHPIKNDPLKPCEVVAGSNRKVWWQCEKGHEWVAQLNTRLKGDNCPYCSNHRVLIGFNDFATTHPELAKEWHPVKNEQLTPQMITRGFNRKVWWQCDKGHEWETSPYIRQKGLSSCPYCSGRKLLTGVNDLATKCPELAKEFHPIKNGELTPSTVKWNFSSDIWWLGKCGHEWKGRVSNRVHNNSGCPYCSGTLVLKGFNDLETRYPELSREYHPTKNKNKLVSDFNASSGQSIWWQCEKGHEWKASIYSRARGNGCPYCSGRLPIVGETDLATTHPHILKEWHPTKNKAITPQQVSAGSNKKVWWLCDKNHECFNSISNRLKSKGCPYCSGRKLLKGFNDLKTLRPDLANEWHPTRNGELTPSDLMSSVAKKVWWQCEKGHEWLTSPNNRARGNGCPYCSGRLPITGETDLETLYPDIANEWHPFKNLPHLPSKTAPNSHEKRWFICEKGHEYDMAVSSRTRPGSGCPYCANKRVLVGFNDFGTIFPHLIKEWHPEKNKNLLPSHFTYGSGTKIWWICREGHEWKASIDSRRGGSGCPFCSESRGEAKISRWIDKHLELTYIRQYRFKDCYLKKQLPFDFAIFKKDQLISLIEYDGEQHFKPVEIFGGEEGFKNQKMRDEVKDAYCIENEIPLLRIAYFDFDRIDDILNDHFQRILKWS